MEIISLCIRHVVNYDKEEFVNAWLLQRINDRGKEQERVVILTTVNLYRCKYSSAGDRVIHHKEYPLSSIECIQKGFLNASKKQYAMLLILKGIRGTSQYYTTAENKNIEQTKGGTKILSSTQTPYLF